MLYIPDVSLLLIDTICPELATRSIEESVSRIEFGDILCFSDQNIWPGYQHIAPLDGNVGYQEFLWYVVPWHALKTSHVLIAQWDSWVIDASMWQPTFLEYDYIGAPWWLDLDNKDCTVGNGGFSLRSKRLMQFLVEHRHEYPMTHPEDGTLCHVYRKPLEAYGFKWAPENIAHTFSFEHKPSADSRHFGFHGMSNFPKVMDEVKLAEYMQLLKANEYTRCFNMKEVSFGAIGIG